MARHKTELMFLDIMSPKLSLHLRRYFVIAYSPDPVVVGIANTLAEAKKIRREAIQNLNAPATIAKDLDF